MTQVWLLLFGLLALGRCQIIYPDQYEIMKAASNPSYGSDGRGSNNNNQPTQYDQQYNPQPTTVQAARYPSVASQTTYYPSTTITPTSTSPSLPQDWSTHVNNIIARGITKFSLDLDRAIYNSRNPSVANNHQNTIFSPLSIGVALSMVLLGSAGNTFDEVSRVLGLEAGVDISQHSEVVHQMFGLLLNIVNHRVEEDNGPRVSSASGIFVQEGFPIRPEFLAISQNAYKSEVINLDFRKKGMEAMNIINNWVKQRTMEKISNILSDPPSHLTNVILASALYFNGEWNQHFINDATKRKPFFIEPNESVEVDMMYNGGFFPFYEDKSLGVKMVQLPYKGMEMSMYVLLPKAEGATALRNFSNHLTREMIEHLINNLKNETTIIGLPRMKLSSSLNLKRALRSLGLHSLFDPNNADLSILSSGYGTLPVTIGAANPYVDSQAVLPQTVIPLANSQVTQTITSNITPPPQVLPQGLPQGLPQSVPRQIPQSLPQSAPRPIPQSLPQSAPRPIPQSLPQSAPRPIPQSLPQSAPRPIPQSLPQSAPRPIPQSLPQSAPRPIPQSLPQNVSRALPVNSAALSQVLSQALPQPLQQVASPELNSYNDYLIFSRFGGNDAGGGARRNYFRYDDEQRGVTIEQWGTGFHIRKIRRIRRDTINGRNDDASRLTYVAKENHDDLRRDDRSNPSTKYVSLEENKYRFRNAGEQKRANRKSRQITRPMDQSFLRFIQSLNFPSYGLDDLRNNAQLTNPGLFADEVLHKVEMDVTEVGTEAAAATVVTLQRDGNQKRLFASRPFLFFIRHDPTELILFWGTVNTPTPNFAAAR